LLLDEPTAGLDVAHVLRFYQLLSALRDEGYALLCVLHDLADVKRHADRTLLLDRGACAGFGPTAEVLQADAVRAVYAVHTHERASLGFSLDGARP
jgi:ABC-type Mn2+/Zn2+ transport system ATPase subunit